MADEYSFKLKFRIQKDGENDYVVRSNSALDHFRTRSVNAEVDDLEPGRYHVLLKVTAERYDAESTEDVVRSLAPIKREKLVQIGLSYDLAHAKGLVIETEKEKKAREEHERNRKRQEREKLKQETRRRREKEWIRERKMSARKERMAERRAAKNRSSRATPADHRNGAPPPAEQILSDVPVQSPSDIAQGQNGNGSDADASNRPRIPTIQFEGNHPSDAQRARKRKRLLQCSLDTSVSTHSTYHELLEGFEFDSELDMPPEEPSDIKTPRIGTSMSLEETNSDPWNAVCVVGLRVYSKDPGLSLEVIRPLPDDGGEAALDMDDPAASATSPKFSFPRSPFF